MTRKPRQAVTSLASPEPPLFVRRAVGVLRAWGASPEMRAAGACAVAELRDDAFGNGLVGLRNAEAIAVAAFEAMVLALEHPTQMPNKWRRARELLDRP